MKQIYGDLDLAEKVEEYAAIDDAAYIDVMKSILPSQKFDIFEFSGGRACYAGNSPFSNVHGFGLDKAEHDQECLENIENFFRSYNCPAILSVATVAEPQCQKLLFDNQYSPLGFRNVYILEEQTGDASDRNQGLEFREVDGEDELQTWLTTVSNGFAGKSLNEPDQISLGQAQKPGNRFFIAFCNGEVAGGSALYVNESFARLGGMATLPNFRGRGIQQGMIRFRVNKAIESGCDIVTSDTNPGNNSQRNLERSGFKLAYARGIYRKNS